MGFDPLSAVSDLIGKVIGVVAPDQNAKLQYQSKLDELKANGELAKMMADTDLAKMQTQLEMANMDVEKIEATSTSLFKSGAHAFVEWVCGCAFAYLLILHNLFAWMSLNFHWVVPPDIDSADRQIVMAVVGGMFGLSKVLHSVEKHRGVA